MSEEILTTPANVTGYLAKGFRVTEVHITGEFGEQLVRMERTQGNCSDGSPTEGIEGPNEDLFKEAQKLELEFAAQDGDTNTEPMPAVEKGTD